MTRRIGLSKSRITLFEQCPKRLWLSVHRPGLAEIRAGANTVFADGHRVGALACSLYPEGVMIGDEQGLGAAAEHTSKLLTSGWDRPIFEGTFAYDSVLVRVDLMLPVVGGWHVAEVKNTTGVKAYHLGDIATQIWVLRAAGVPVADASIRHLDRTFTLTRDGDYSGLFTDSFVTADIEPVIDNRAAAVAAAREALAGPEPIREVGAHCDDPFTCSFKSYCGRDLPPPPIWPVTLLPDTAGKNVANALLARGIDDLTRATAADMPNPKLARIHAATTSGLPYRDRNAIVAETSDWSWPRIFLDFETIQFAVPRWLGTRPFQQIPFQFSAHVMDEDGTVSHREFLSIDGSDPRRACAEALAALPPSGAVVAWNASFERGCLLGLADLFPDLAPALAGLAARLVDLLPVARRHYYHRDMRGSWSIKAVLPTLGVPGYAELGSVQSGTDAQSAYLEAIAPETGGERRQNLRESLLDYCARDTEAMMIVLDRLTLPVSAGAAESCSRSDWRRGPASLAGPPPALRPTAAAKGAGL